MLCLINPARRRVAILLARAARSSDRPLGLLSVNICLCVCVCVCVCMCLSDCLCATFDVKYLGN